MADFPVASNGFEDRELVLGKKLNDVFVLDGLAHEDQTNCFEDLVWIRYFSISLVKPIQNCLDVSCVAVEALIQIMENLPVKKAFLTLEETVGKNVIGFFIKRA